MQLSVTRGVHAAVIISDGSSTIVVDPGAFGFPEEAMKQANAVLVTHDHFDHVDLPSLTASLEQLPDLKVYSPTPLDLGEHSDRVTVVSEGETFTVGEIPVRVVGREQNRASLDDGFIANVGYVCAEAVLHPGDAYHDEKNLELLFTAMMAPWQNRPQLEEHLRSVTPRRAVGIHDVLLSKVGGGILPEGPRRHCTELWR